MSGGSGSSDSHNLAIPNQSVSAQDLVRGNYTLAGWLRKRGKLNVIPGARKVIPWNPQFVVLYQGCLYTYKSETSRKPSRAFSLYGYNTVYRAGEVLPAEAPWAFKICHTYPEYKTYYFSAMTEQHMKEWMKQVKSEMRKANHRLQRTSADGQDDEDERSLSYEDIEREIYTDPSELVMNESTPLPPKADDDSEDENYVDSDEIPNSPTSPTPPVKPRPPLPKPADKPVRPARDEPKQIAQELNKKLNLKQAPKKPLKDPPVRRSIKVTPFVGRITPPSNLTNGDRGDGRSFTEKQAEKPKPAKLKFAGANQGGRTSPSLPTEVAPPPPEAAPEQDYWSAIYYDEKGGKPSGELIRELAENGVFLIRNSSSGDAKVLVLFYDHMPKKYKIFHDNSKNPFYLVEEKRFPSIEELIYHYLSNKLPCGVCLSQPYFQHPKYKP